MEVTWDLFRRSPMKYLTQSKDVRIRRRDQSYFIVRYFSPYVEDGIKRKDRKIVRKVDGGKVKKVNHRCGICGKSERVLWVVPYDGSMSPGWYCWICRRERSILDVKKAKRYGKIV